jgi:hypothetical protein
MPEQAYKQSGAAEVVNGVGYSTRVVDSCPHPDVLQAMTEDNTAFVEIDDPQATCPAGNNPDDLITAIGTIIKNPRRESP